MQKLKLTRGEVKTINNALAHLSKIELASPGWKTVALNLIELEGEVSKIDKYIFQVATKLNYVKNGTVFLQNQEEVQKLNKELDPYLNEEKSIPVSLESIAESCFEEIKLPADLVKCLLKYKIIN